VRATISIAMDDGTFVEGVVELQPQRRGPGRPVHLLNAAPGPDNPAAVDFSSGVRPFMKKHAGGLSGPERLILLVAHFAKGKVHTPVARGDVVRQWGKMKPIMGGKYNGAYDTRARETGWLDSPKPGLFELRAGWEWILK
jgi:hypothetical protein